MKMYSGRKIYYSHFAGTRDKWRSITLLAVSIGLCACSSLANKRAQTIDKQFIPTPSPQNTKPLPIKRSLTARIDRNTIPHVHPDMIFAIARVTKEAVGQLAKSTFGGMVLGGTGAYAINKKIWKKLFASKLKPVKIIAEAPMQSELLMVGGVASGGAIGTGYGAIAGLEHIDTLKDQEGLPIPDKFLYGFGLEILKERPIDRACAIYYITNTDTYYNLGMQYQEELRRYSYAMDTKYRIQNWLKKCPEKPEILHWCKDNEREIADKHPAVYKACQELPKNI